MLGLLAVALVVAPQTRFRGTMIPTLPTSADLTVLGKEWHANLCRWQLTWEGFPRSKADTATIPEYRSWLDGVLKRVDECLPTCRQVGLHVVLDLHTAPGGRDDANNCVLFQKRELADEFVAIWQMLAKRYKGERQIWAFDLLNEATTSDKDVVGWPDLALRAAKAIRAIDPKRTIIYEPAPWASCAAFANLKPLPLDNVVYSPHCYDPFQFTHQGIYGNPTPVSYPGTIAGEQWDKSRLEKSLAPVDEFQRKYKVPIYMGEFSAIRWAPDNSNLRWLSDLIDLLEARGWNWSYHAFREWDGWSVEHGPNPDDHSPSPTPTARKRLLLKWFALNR